MDFVLTDDQAALQHELRRFLTARSPIDMAEAGADDGGSVVDRSVWSELGEMGVFDLRASGFGWAEEVIVFEELGRAALPGPVIPTFLAAGMVDGAAAGNAVVGYTDDGTPALVEHLADLDALLIGDADEVAVASSVPLGHAVPRPLDPLTPLWRVDELPAGRVVGARDDFERHAGLLSAAFQVGLGQTALNIAVAHASHRRQFGRPIGVFQSIKHLLADAAVGIEIARAAVQGAAVSVDEGAEPMGRAASARVVGSRAADQAGRVCVQVHGGLGFTWDLDAHRLLKRSWVLDAAFGGVDGAVAIVARNL